MRLKTNPSPLDVLTDGMRLHHDRARRRLEQVRVQGRNKTDEARREALEDEAAAELKAAADFAKAAAAYMHARARSEEGTPLPPTFQVEVEKFDD